MPDLTAARFMGTFVDMLNTVTTAPTADLTAYLHSAVVYGGSGTKSLLFESDQASNIYGELVGSPQARTALQDFSALMVAYCASHTAGTIFDTCFNKLHGNAELDAWFNDNGTVVGNALVVQHVLQATQPDPQATETLVTCRELMDREGFVDELVRYLDNGRLLSALTEGHERRSVCLPAKVLMLLLERFYADNVEVQQRRARLLEDASGAYYDFVVGYDAYEWLAGIKTSFATEGSEFGALQGSVRAAMVNQTSSDSPDHNDTPYYNEYGPIIPYSGGTTTVTTGASMVAWLSYNSSKYFVDAHPVYQQSQHYGGGCVMEGTLIAVAPGILVPIEDIAENTPVYSVGGSLSFTSAELVRNASVTDFYAVNGDEPFMSFEHPILTQDGFKCLDPDTAKTISPDAPVSRLRVGDVLNRAVMAEDGTMTYVTEEVRCINVAHIEDVTSYDLHFKEGYNSYHANGYACLLNYPELTVAGVEERLSFAFDRAQRRRILKKLASDEVVRQMVGETTVAYIEQMVANPIPELKAAENQFLESSVPRLRFQQIEFEGADRAPVHAAIGLHGLSLYRERLFGFAGDAPIDLEHRGRRVFFKAPAPADACGAQESTGVLNLVHDGLMAKGAVIEGGRVRRFTAYNEDRFELMKNGAVFGRLCVEHVKDPVTGSSVPVVRLYLSDSQVEGGFKLADGCSCSIGTRTFSSGGGTPTHRRCIDVFFPAIGVQMLACAHVAIPNHFHLLFDALVESAVEDDRVGEVHGITAQLLDDDDLGRFDTAITATCLAAPPVAERLYALPTSLVSARQEEALDDALGLCVEELYSLPVPESLGAVHQNSFAMFMNMMFYKADDAVLEVFGRTRPSVGPGKELSSDVGALADEHAAFLHDQFGVGYACNSLQYWDDPYIKKIFASIDHASEKLDYYLKGDDDARTLGLSADYGAIMSALNIVNYRTCVPDLAKYAADTTGAWGSALYAYSTLEENRQNRALTCVPDDQVDNGLRHISSMLDVLDAQPHVQQGERTVSYGAAYLALASDTQCANIVDSFSVLPTHISPDDFVPLARVLAAQMYDAAFEGAMYCGDPLPPEVVSAVLAEAQGQSREDYIEGTAAALRAGLMATQIAEDTWFSWLRSAGAAKSIIFSVLLSVASFLTLWYSTPESIRGKDVASIVATVFETVGGIVDVVSLYKLNKVLICKTVTIEEVLEALRFAKRGITPIRFIGGGGELMFDIAHIAEIEAFKISRSVLKGANLALSGVFLVLSVIDAATGWKSDTPARRAFAVIDVVANSVLCCVALVDLFGLACPLVNVIGGVCIAVSIICQLFLMFLPKKHEPSVSETYLLEVGKPFIEGLPEPSAFYLEKKRLIDEYTASTDFVQALAMERC